MTFTLTAFPMRKNTISELIVNRKTVEQNRFMSNDWNGIFHGCSDGNKKVSLSSTSSNRCHRCNRQIGNQLRRGCGTRRSNTKPSRSA